MGRKLKDRINSLGRGLGRELRNLGRSTENVIKEAAIPVIITVATGGTGAAVASTVAGVAVSRQAKKRIKDPVAKAAVGTAITASFGGCKNVPKEVAKAVVTTTLAKKTKSVAVGAIVSSGICGDYKNISEAGKGIVKEVVSESVVKTVAKKTNNQLLIQGAGHLARAGVDNVLSQPKSQNITVAKEEETERSNYSNLDTIIEENNRMLLNNFDNNNLGNIIEENNNMLLDNFDNNNYNHIDLGNNGLLLDNFDNSNNSHSDLGNIIEENNRLLLDNFDNNNLDNYDNLKMDFEDSKLDRDPSIIEKFKSPKKEPLKGSKSSLNKERINNKKRVLNVKNTVQPMTNLDSGKSTVRLKTVFNKGNRTASVTNDLKNIKVSSMTKLNNKVSTGSALTYSGNDIRYGRSSKINNNYNEFGIGIETDKGIWNNEVYGYNINKTDIETDVTGGCVTKKIYEYDLEVPLCGKVGTISQNTTVCNDSITTTDKVGLNSNAAICGAQLVPAGKAVSIAYKSTPIVIKNAGKVVGSLATLEEVAVAAN